MASSVHYFAYGSNLYRARLQQRVPSATVISQGQLLGYRLRFNKIGLDGSGKGNIEATGCSEDSVWGAIFQLDPTELPALDRAESLGVGYARHPLKVVTPQGNITAFTYIALLKDNALSPFHWYKAYVVVGAMNQGLPTAYIHGLRAVLSVPDPDAQRCRQNTLRSDIAQLHQALMLNDSHPTSIND
ncbi:gamma-glutamylcyclotransferase family protein [Acaryochloris sp. IP29b_bin.148]|uniref:gamma-glutamylcyclotransferase family protein n=1 Tax=Acaryochloris sp. IP29b_bin.148 TaxID=2969218 RepID=UPI0026313C8B|nr:gamma-glutamylcyclotransferase family protein [Acaryochloris sp. IP29b_bin.148]